MKYKLSLIATFIAFAIVGTAQTNGKPVSDSGKKLFISVQIEAQFPGGPAAWKKYLQKNLNANLPKDNGAPAGRYTVMLSFLVEKDGAISDIIAENNPGYGSVEEAIRAIKKGPKWQPAEYDGHYVSDRVRQAVTFMVNY